MDFYRIRIKETKSFHQAYPDWVVDYSKDLMIRGGAFYAVWDEAAGMWSTNEYDVQRLVDEDLTRFVEEAKKKGEIYEPLYCRSFATKTWESFNRFIKNLPSATRYQQLDDHLTFANTQTKKSDYVSKRLPYSLEEGRTDAWDELLGILYAPEERDKIEWSIGAIVSGDSRWLEKFLVFYGPPGSGKSTVIRIIEKLFEGYITAFEAKALVTGNSSFSMEAFQNNPLVAIQHDGDLSRIEDNTKLNSIVGHDAMTMNVKFKSSYTIKPKAFLIMGTNKPVKITDAKAGNTRRLIDVHPTGVKIESQRYHILMENINFELGAIAYKCLQRYQEMGKYYYEGYIPTKMMMLTDAFYNFVEAYYDVFKEQDFVRLKQAWELYKQYCDESNIIKRLQYHEVRDELSNYFEEFKDRHYDGIKEHRSVYLGFKGLPQQGPVPFVPDTSYVIELSDYDPVENGSAFNDAYLDQPAQLANEDEFPTYKWENVKTQLKDIDTTKLHYVKVPTQHIVLDFDLKDENGEKDLEQNIEAASQFPPTYTELSKSARGVHLHYLYKGDVSQLASQVSDGVEIKALLGDSSLRRRLTKCNNLEIAELGGGLPTKEKKMLDKKNMQSEKSLRDLIKRNLGKEIHPGTKPSVDFIHHILEEAYEQGLAYNVEDMRPAVLSFAASSTNHSVACIKLVQTMKFVGKDMEPVKDDDDQPIVFYDVEVYPNLFVVCWKTRGSDTVVRMINPTSEEIEPLMAQKLVGFNNRRYDNHILYAAYLGYSLEGLFKLSQEIVVDNKNNNAGLFGEAYNISYADIYDFSSKKQGLKKFQIELGIHHSELDIPWDQPVPEDMWDQVVEYCVNDVISTEEVFESRRQDFAARQILAEMSGLTVNHTTQTHTAKIIFGNDPNPQNKFIYTDLSEMFPGYSFDGKESTYRGEVVGEGGYVYAEPGYYENVVVLDVVSMHPTSLIQLNLFGDEYTAKFKELIDRRIEAKTAGDEDLSYALKIIINSVYGYTSARFPNKFRDNRNKDNIVAKRGALFMIDLKNAVQEKGFKVVHIKTDSIKVPEADEGLKAFIYDFGRSYGYTFEVEDTYDKFCLVNDAVYVAREEGKWSAVGAQFQHPYVFKTLFSHDPIEFDDLCETKNVSKGRMYLDKTGAESIEDMIHVGRTGSFMPVKYDGGTLWRIQDDKRYHVTGTKGFNWIDRDVAYLRATEDDLHTDMEYFQKLQDEAVKTIEKFVPIDKLIS